MDLKLIWCCVQACNLTPLVYALSKAPWWQIKLILPAKYLIQKPNMSVCVDIIRRGNVWLWERTKLQNMLETGLNVTTTAAYTTKFYMLMFESTPSNIWWYRTEHAVHPSSLPLSPPLCLSSHSLTVSLFVFAPACFLWPNMQISFLPFDVHEVEPQVACIQSCVSNLSIINQQYPTVFTQPITDTKNGCILYIQ